MFVRDAIGGMVFYQEQVLLLQNEKNEWGFPLYSVRGIQEESLRETILTEGLLELTHLNVKVKKYVGRSEYEFYSFTRRRPVRNEIRWYLLVIDQDEKPFIELKDDNAKYIEAGFFSIEDAMDMITYSQDREKLATAYKLHLAESDAL